MPNVVKTAAATLLAMCLGGAAPAQPSSGPPDAAPTVEQLIGQLGDESFARREAATEQLIRLGLAVLPAVRNAANHPDREVRYRCERILLLVGQLERQRQFDAFLARKPGSEQPLPAWPVFRDLVGDNGTNRALFVQMLDNEWELLEGIGQDAADSLQRIGRRLDETQAAIRMQEQIPLGTVAALLLVVCDEQINLPDAIGAKLCSLCYQQQFGVAIRSPERSAPLRKMLGTWIARADGASYQTLFLAMRYDLPEGLTPAEKTLNGGKPLAEGLVPLDDVAGAGAMAAHTQQYAMLALAKLGDRRHVPLLARYFERTEVCGTMTVNNEKYETQLRDAALVVSIHLCEQKPADFGFSKVRANSQMVFNPGTMGFKSDEDRQAAHKKWREFQEKPTPQP